MEENDPERMYLPAYYKVNKAKQFFYTVNPALMISETVAPGFKGVKKVYMSFSVGCVYNYKTD